MHRHLIGFMLIVLVIAPVHAADISDIALYRALKADYRYITEHLSESIFVFRLAIVMILWTAVIPGAITAMINWHYDHESALVAFPSFSALSRYNIVYLMKWKTWAITIALMIVYVCARITANNNINAEDGFIAPLVEYMKNSNPRDDTIWSEDGLIPWLNSLLMKTTNKMSTISDFLNVNYLIERAKSVLKFIPKRLAVQVLRSAIFLLCHDGILAVLLGISPKVVYKSTVMNWASQTGGFMFIAILEIISCLLLSERCTLLASNNSFRWGVKTFGKILISLIFCLILFPRQPSPGRLILTAIGPLFGPEPGTLHQIYLDHSN